MKALQQLQENAKASNIYIGINEFEKLKVFHYFPTNISIYFFLDKKVTKNQAKIKLHPALPNHGIEQKKQGKPLFVDSHDWAFTPTHGPQFWLADAQNNDSKVVPLSNLEITKCKKIQLLKVD